MNVLIILAHPDPKSFNYAIAERVSQTIKQSGHQLTFHDLYKENFDPVLRENEIPKQAEYPEEIRLHCQDLANANGIVIIHPNWWGQPPAILKGWIDRVLRAGIAYEFLEGDNGEGIPIGLLQAKWVMVFNTSNTEKNREINVFGDPLEQLWNNCIFDLCGIKDFYRRMFRIIVTSTEKQRAGWLNEVEQIIQMKLV